MIYEVWLNGNYVTEFFNRQTAEWLSGRINGSIRTRKGC